MIREARDVVGGGRDDVAARVEQLARLLVHLLVAIALALGVWSLASSGYSGDSPTIGGEPMPEWLAPDDAWGAPKLRLGPGTRF